MARRKQTDVTAMLERSSSPDADQVRRLYDDFAASGGMADGILDECRKAEAFDPKDFCEQLGVYDLWRASDKRQPQPAGLKEAIVFEPGYLGVPVGSGNAMAKLALEDKYWSPAGGSSIVNMGSTNLAQVQQLACRLYTTHPLARNIINGYTFLTIGEGVKVTWKTRNSGKGKQAYWDSLARKTKFQRRIKLMVRMTYLLGEWFMVTFPLKRTATAGARKQEIRGVEPDRIESIFLNSEDLEDVRGYTYRRGDDVRSVLSPEDVVHSRVGDLGNVPRGIPILLPVLTMLRYWSLFVENRHWLNMTRARLPVVRKIKGSAGQIQTEKARLTSLPKPGTIAIDPEAAEWTFPSHNIGGADAKDDGRLLSLAIAAGVNLPEFLVTADASNANYSSSLVAESPTVRMFLDYQDVFRGPIEELIRELTGEEDGFSVEFPPVLRRGVGELAAALGTAVDRKFMSRQTACEMLGRDWTEERERIGQEDDLGFDTGLDLPSPFGKRDDGGNGDPKAGASLGATASSQAANDRETAA